MAIGKVNSVAPNVNETVASVRIQYHKKLTAEREKSETLLAQQATYLERIKELESEVNRHRTSSKFKDAPQTKNTIETKNVERLATEISEFRQQYKQEQNDLQKEISSLREQNAELETRLGKAERELGDPKKTRQATDVHRTTEKKEGVEKIKTISKSLPPERQSKDSKAGQHTKTANAGNGSKLKEVSLPIGFSSDEMRKVFKRFDYNGNGILSLAEIDKALIEGYPHLAVHKPAIMRAYKAADSSNDGFIQFKEFHQLMDYLYVYDAYFVKFQGMDENNDKRLTVEEFMEGYATAFGSAGGDLEMVFRSIDKNGGGYILFDEFCLYLADETQKRNNGATQNTMAEKKELVEQNKPTSKSVLPERQPKDSKARQQIKTSGTENGSMVKETPLPTGFSSDEMRKVFKRFDYNGNGILSLAEIDKALIEGYPHLAVHKPAIMRAYKAADGSGDGFIQFREFHQLMDYLYVYDAYFVKFQGMDENNDKRLTLEEFKKGYATAFGSAGRDLETVFRSIDTNGGGYILFDEFCLYLADETQKRNNGATQNTTAEQKDVIEKGKPTSKSVVPERQSNDSEAGQHSKTAENGTKVKETPLPTGFSSDEMRKVFKRFDYNGNGLLSLAEIDKALIEGYPHLAVHKPAIMRAYKAADGSGDGFIQFKEFHQLMDYLYVYDAYFVKFQGMDENNDKRLTLEEFKGGYETTFGSAGVDLETVFRSIDKNGGGYILFDEFCLYLADETQKRNSRTVN